MWKAIVGEHKVEAFIDDMNRIPNQCDEFNNKYSKSITYGTIADRVRAKVLYYDSCFTG